jgi:hypothetical protein
MWATCLRSASAGYHAGFQEGCYQKQTSSLDISIYQADVHEGQGSVSKWQHRGMV